MGGSTKIYQSLQMYTIMEEYGELKETLFLNSATQVSKGMEYVNEGTKRNMVNMRSAFNPGITKALGYEKTAATTIKTLDNDLLFEYITDNIDSDADRIISSRTGAPTEEEVGVDYLQETYSDFNGNDWTFTHTDDILYRYVYSIYSGDNQIDIVSYKVISVSDVGNILQASYDEFDITSMPIYPSTDGWEIPFTYTEYTVTVDTTTTTTDDDGNETTTEDTEEYVTTKLNGVTEGTTTEDDTTTDTSIDSTTKSDTLVIPVEYLYLSAGTAIDTFMEDYIAEYSGDTISTTLNAIITLDNDLNNEIVDFAENKANRLFSVQDLLDRGDADIVEVEYTITLSTNSAMSANVVISDINILSVDNSSIDPDTLLISDYVLESILSERKTIEEDKIKKAWAEYDSSTNVIVYQSGDNTKQVFLSRVDIEHCYIDKELDSFPVIPLKENGILDENTNKGIILKQMGMSGDEFNESLADKDLKYAAIGFSIPINIAPASLVYNTLEDLEATGVNTTGEKEWTDSGEYRNTAGTSFTLEYGNLKMITELDLYKEVKSGYYDSSEVVGKYYMYTEEYDYNYTERDFFGKPVTKSKSAIRYHYIKQETEDYYIVRTIDRIRTEYRYNGATADTALGDRIYTDVDSDKESIIRLPILRGALTGIGYNDYLTILERSLTLFVHSYVEVRTSWYQSGFFKFVMVIIAVVVAVVSWGSASKFSYKILYYAASIGATATAVLAMSSLMGLDLGFIGDILQIVAILGGIVSVVNMAYNMTSQGAAALANAQGELAAEAFRASEEALANGSIELAEEFAKEGSRLAALSAENAMLSVGEVFTIMTPASEGLKTVTKSLKQVTDVSIKIPGTDLPIADSLKIIKESIDVAGKVMNYTQQRKIGKLSVRLSDVRTAREKAEEELQEMQDTRHKALLMAPSQVSSYYDDMLNLDSIFDLSSNLELPSTSMSVW